VRYEFVTYEVGLPYDGPEDFTPDVDSVGLIFEGVPVYKIWLHPPYQSQVSLLQGTCTHIGLSSPSEEIGSMPFFVFGNSEGAAFRVQAPMCSAPVQEARWARGDSNAFIFVLIDLSSSVVQSITCVGVPVEFRRMLIKLWSGGAHANDLLREPEDLHAAILKESRASLKSALSLWEYRDVSGKFDQVIGVAEKPLSRGNGELIELSTIDIAVGERIQFTREHRALRIAAHELGTVVELDKQGNASVVLDNQGRTVQFNLKDMPFLQYGYAVGSFGPKPKSVKRLALDEDNDSPTRRKVVQILDGIGYVPVNRRSRTTFT
jgi:hypothetical protein